MTVNTATKDNLSATFDWIEFTILNTNLQSLITDILQLEPSDFTALSKGRFGYNAQSKWSNGNLFLLYNTDNNPEDPQPLDDDRMGVHVMITGTGCRHYEARRSLQELIVVLVAMDKDSNFTRIDLAIDDIGSNVVNFTRIHKAAISGNFTSRWNKWDEVNSRECASGAFIGRTMYFGSQSSDIFCRIYDKTLERQANADKGTEIPESWTRMEIVYKKERAKLLAYYLIDHDNVGVLIRETLNNYARFLQRPRKSGDSNKSRWPSAKWWDMLLGCVGTLQLTIQREEKTIDDMANWLDAQIGPTLAAIMTAKEGESDWLHKIISDGAGRLKQKHKDAISQYQNYKVEEINE